MIPGAFSALIAPMRFRAPRRLPIAFGWLAKRPIDREAEDSYVFPAITSGEIRADVRRFIRGIDRKALVRADDRLGEFGRPALIAWSAEDKLFPLSDGESLARELPDARLEPVEDAFTFSMEDNPARLSELIAGFVREPARAAA
jgi:pimeloyl-ACP methyl ester carboxylesterase